MDRPDQDRAEEDPEQGRHPTPYDSQGRSDNGTGSCNTREVVSEDDTLPCRDIIVPIRHRDRGHSCLGIQLEDPACEKLSVGMISYQVEDKGPKGDGKSLGSFG